MRCDAVEANTLGDHAVVVRANPELRSWSVGPVLVLSVCHHRDVHVVHDAELDELRLAAQEFQLALTTKAVAVLYLDELLGRNDEQGHAACQVFKHAGSLEAHGNG